MAVYLVDVSLKPDQDGIIKADDDGDNNHMALFIPARDELYCSYYYFPTMTKKDLDLPEQYKLPYTNELTPLVMSEQFHQNDDGQIDGAGSIGQRYKKIHRAYRLTLRDAMPAAHRLKTKFGAAFGLGYGFKYREV